MIDITKHPNDPRGNRLTTEIRLPTPLADVFEFFSDAYNLEEITPPWLHFTVQTPAPIEMKRGALIDYRLRLHGIPIRWRTEITAWDPPYRFVDEQLRGPYRYWRHEHTFQEQDGKTIAHDQVEYSVPGGALIHWLLVKSDVRRIFEYRSQILTRRFAQRLNIAPVVG
jgi:ligand-binding SRPBCC domain-containing protein